jgi:hypothetical protein
VNRTTEQQNGGLYAVELVKGKYYGCGLLSARTGCWLVDGILFLGRKLMGFYVADLGDGNGESMRAKCLQSLTTFQL